MSESFCVLPFISLDSQNNGDVWPCCKNSTVLGNLNDTSISGIWNTSELQKLRQDLIQGKKPQSCAACWNEEAFGIASFRQRMNILNQAELQRVTSHPLSPELSENSLRQVEVKLSNTCNLKCRHCSLEFSTSWKSESLLINHLLDSEPNKKKLSSQTSLDWFKNSVQHLEVIRFGGGEPLLDPNHLPFLQLAQEWAPRITLVYNTNLTNFGPQQKELFRLWKRFKKVSVSISIDGHEELFEYIRSNGKLTTVLSNIEELRNQFSHCEIAIKPTIMTYNLLYLVEIFQLIYSLELPSLVNRVHAPKFLSTTCFTKIQKQQISEILEVKFLNASNQLSPKQAVHLKNKIQAEIQYMNSQDDSVLWPKFLNYAKILDHARGTSLENWLPKEFLNADF